MNHEADAAAVFHALAASSDRSVLLHGDFHRRNVLLSHRGWLAIDPLSMAGDPCFDVALFLRQDRHDAATVARVGRLSERLGLDRHRTRSWLFALAIQAGSWHLSIGRLISPRQSPVASRVCRTQPPVAAPHAIHR